MTVWLKKLSGPAEARVVSLRRPAAVGALVAAPDKDSVYFGDEEGRVFEWRPPHPEPTRMGDAGAAVLGLACGGGRLAVLTGDHRLRIGSASAERLTWTEELPLPKRPVFWGFAEGNEGRLVVVSEHGRALVWDLSAPHSRPLVVESAESDGVVCCATAGPESVLWLGCADGALRGLDWKRGRVLVRREVRSAVFALEQLPNGDLVSGHENGQLCVWSPRGPCVVGGDGDPAVSALAYLNGRRAVVSGRRAAGGPGQPIGFGGQVRVLSLNGEPALRPPVLLHADSVLLLRPVDAGRLLSAGADGCVKLWDVERDPGGCWPRPLAQHDRPVAALVRLPDGRVLSAAGRTLSCWVPPDGREPRPEEWCQWPCRVDADGELVDAASLRPHSTLAAGCLALSRSGIVVGDDAGGVWLVRRPGAAASRAGPGALGGDGASLASEGDRGEDPAAGAGRPIEGAVATAPYWSRLYGGLVLGGTAVATAPLAAAYWSGGFSLPSTLPPPAGKERRTGDGKPLVQGDDPVEAVEMMADEERMVTGHRSGAVRLWDLPSGRCRQVFTGQGGCRALACWSRPLRIAVGRRDGEVHLWGAGQESPTVLARLRGPVNAVAFLAEGRLVVAGEDGCLKVVEAAGTELACWWAPEPFAALTIGPENEIVAVLRSRRVLRFGLKPWRRPAPAPRQAERQAPAPPADRRPVRILLHVPTFRRAGLHGQGAENAPEFPAPVLRQAPDGVVKTSVYPDQDAVVVEVTTTAPSLFGATVGVVAAAASVGLTEEGVIRLEPDSDNAEAGGYWTVPDSGLYTEAFEVSLTFPAEEGGPA